MNPRRSPPTHNAAPSAKAHDLIKKRIIESYDNWIVRAYCTIRFRIINLRILEEIEQYIPPKGTTLDLGCGFGLFSLYFALRMPTRRILSLDLSKDRIELARRASLKLTPERQIEFHQTNVLDYEFDQPVDAVVTLDLLHHLPEDQTPLILARCHAALADGGILIVKDVDASSRLKTAFTWVLDKIMAPRSPVRYYRRDEMKALLERAGFSVKLHQMLDVLPYPHVLYVCKKVGGSR